MNNISFISRSIHLFLPLSDDPYKDESEWTFFFFSF